MICRNRILTGNSFNWRISFIGTDVPWTTECQLQGCPFILAVEEGCWWSASRSDNLTPGERAPGTHWIGGLVGPGICLGVVANSSLPLLVLKCQRNGLELVAFLTVWIMRFTSIGNFKMVLSWHLACLDVAHCLKWSISFKCWWTYASDFVHSRSSLFQKTNEILVRYTGTQRPVTVTAKAEPRAHFYTIHTKRDVIVFQATTFCEITYQNIVYVSCFFHDRYINNIGVMVAQSV
jgi:hypothetical protein